MAETICINRPKGTITVKNPEITSNIMAIRICSAVKNPDLVPGDFTYLRDMYFQINLKGFFRRMQELKIPYAVVSRKYGICEEGPNNVMYADIEN